MSVWVNYDDVLLQLRDAGLEVETLDVGTTKPIRCRERDGNREKRCWYWLSDIELTNHDGGRQLFITGAWGIYRGAENLKGKIDLKLGRRKIEITAQQRAAMEARHQETKKRAKAMRLAEIQRAADQAKYAWSRYVQDGTSEYLTRKRVQGHGVRFSPSGNGTIAIPMQDVAGRIWGLQIIRGENVKNRRLTKEYWPKGLDKVGHFHLLGAPQAGGVLLLCEGFATGGSLHQASGLPVAVAFDAGNLIHVATALRAAYQGVLILVCADDDYQQKCRECHAPTVVAEPLCRACAKPHRAANPGIEAAKAAAFAVAGAWVAPIWPFDRAGEKITDFNDLAVHAQGGPHLVRAQVWDAIRVAGWDKPRDVARVGGAPPSGGGGGERHGALSVMPLNDAVERFVPIDDGTGKAMFDTWTQRLVLSSQMVALLPAGVRWDDVKRHPSWINRGSYYLDQVGFDPAGTDQSVLLNTWRGWPNQPVAGDCKKTLDLLRYLCSGEENADEVYRWVLCWLAYPLKHAGAKMKSAIVVHGPQGTGKSMFFEAIADIYGEYGILLNQGAIEDKFNSDWSSRKLYVVADEIVAKQDMHHIKNQLKTFITGDWIRVNPKNLPAYRERNHMNIVFLSNEKQPVVLENDDRRHCVIWTPPSLAQSHYDAIRTELEAGGLQALHQYLMEVDLIDFHPWTRPPMTRSKMELQDLGRSSVERFVHEWKTLAIESSEGKVMPLCPCLGSQLYVVYRKWCERTGERDLGDKRLIGHLKKLHDWSAGNSEATWRSFSDLTHKTRKMVVPSVADMQAAVDLCSIGAQEKLHPDRFDTRREWLTAGFFEFAMEGGFDS